MDWTDENLWSRELLRWISAQALTINSLDLLHASVLSITTNLLMRCSPPLLTRALRPDYVSLNYN